MPNFNYYHVSPSDTLGADPARYPRNFVEYSPLLAPLRWLDRRGWRPLLPDVVRRARLDGGFVPHLLIAERNRESEPL